MTVVDGAWNCCRNYRLYYVACRIKYAGKEKPKRRYGYYDSVVTSHGWSNDRIFIFQSKVFKLIFKFQRK